METVKSDLRYLQLLSQSYPSVASASTEIINLEAILNLPKPTEHFISDPHGESDAFNHVLRNASGYIKRKARQVLGDDLPKARMRDLCTLIYYPEQKLALLKSSITSNPSPSTSDPLNDFYTETLTSLVKVCREISSKYTRSKVRKVLPKDFEYIIEELLHTDSSGKKKAYYSRIIESIIETDRADAFIIEISHLIQRLAIDRLHLLGDIFDRGDGAHLIMDTLMDFHKFDIVWGNHDIEWFGAATGNRACMCNVLRIALRYGHLVTLEDGYGINLLPLATFAMDTYADDPCTAFLVRKVDRRDRDLDPKMARLISQMHKAITIIQFKCEAEIIRRRAEFGMEDRLLLDKIDYQKGTVSIDGHRYKLLDTQFPTIDPLDPFRLTPEEEDVVAKLAHSFRISSVLQRHMQCLLSHGSMYNISNGNLMYHASVPLNEDGSLMNVTIQGHKYKGVELMKKVENLIRTAFQDSADSEQHLYAVDFLWYLWQGPHSPLFDKDRMTTFERYFIADEKAHREEKGFYYSYSDDAKVMDRILNNFGVKGKHRHIINGHVPVRIIKGETPVKAGGKHLVIDGGFSTAYQPKTGIAGYTLVFDSHGLELVQHQPFLSAEDAIRKGEDIKSTTQIVESTRHRLHVKDTDKGHLLQQNVDNLKNLLAAYKQGIIKSGK